MTQAIAVLGINRTRDGDLKQMIRALKSIPFLNTAEENTRLEAAEFVTKRWSAYQAECSARRNRRT